MRNHGSKHLASLVVLASVLLWAAPARGAISIGPSGAGPLTFDTVPAVGDFGATAITSGAGGAAFATGADLDTFIVPLPASTIINASGALPQSNTLPPSPFAYAFRYNSNAAGRFIQSRATTSNAPSATPSAAVTLLATLQNDSGSDLSTLIVSYDMTTNNPAVGELPGHRVYFNVTGAAGSWQVINALSGIETNGRLSATLDLGSWPAGTPMYLLWIDDNANGVTDGSYAIDNMTFSFPTPVAPELVSSPTNVVAEERQSVTLSVGVTGAVLDFHWYRGNGSPVLSSSNCNNGAVQVITAGGPNLTFSSVEPADAGDYYCIVSNALGSVTSDPVTLTVNPDIIAPQLLYATPGTNAAHFLIHLSEPLNDACLPVGNGLVTQPSTWYIDEILPGGGERSLGLAGFLNTPDITGALVLGLIAGSPPSSPTNPVRITLVEPLADTSVVQNFLTVGTVVYVQSFSNELVSFSHPWRYNDTDADPGPDWFQPGYNAGAFPEGPGPFDAKRAAGGAAGTDCRDTITFYGLGPVGTCIRLLSPVPPGTNTLITANFWTKFQFGGDPASATLRWHGKLDDGAVIYLNGQELQRLRMPAAPAVITRATLASGGVGDGDPEDAFEFLFPPALRHGENTLAVELHQATIGSSDFTMAMQVSATYTPAPKLQLGFNGTDVTVTWQPDYGVLEYSDTLAPGSWSTVPGGFNGYSEPASGTRYFRVRMP